MASKNELACVYAALILVDDDIAVTGEKIQTILKAANVEVDPYWPGLFAKSFEGINPKDLITNVGQGIGVAAPSSAVSATVAPTAAAELPKAEEKKKEESDEESDDDMGFGLFD